MKQQILDSLMRYIKENDAFCITADIAIDETMVGLPLFGEPLVGVCAARDEWFDVFKREGVVGEHHRMPTDWLPNANAVVSVFLPFSIEVRQSNRGGDWPSSAWLHARFEGQKAINQMAGFLCAYLKQQGFDAVAPSVDKRFQVGHNGYPYTSNWSERHVAFACNLGTFSLSKGLITQRGVAGRFVSVVTEAPIPIDVRQTREKQATCSLCGACIAACPAQAITFERGKDHAICSAFLQSVLKAAAPRYGCGKCQTGMPCEAAAPPGR